MLAIGMLRGKSGVHTFELPKPEIKQPDEVLVRVKEAGVDGTDFNMVKHNLQDIAEGRNKIVMGHEMVGVVEAVGSDVKSVAVYIRSEASTNKMAFSPNMWWMQSSML